MQCILTVDKKMQDISVLNDNSDDQNLYATSKSFLHILHKMFKIICKKSRQNVRQIKLFVLVMLNVFYSIGILHMYPKWRSLSGHKRALFRSLLEVPLRRRRPHPVLRHFRSLTRLFIQDRRMVFQTDIIDIVVFCNTTVLY